MRPLWFVLAIIVLTSSARGQRRTAAVMEDEERIKNVVVLITTDGDPKTAPWGAGIIVGESSGIYYIATARHVLKDLGGKHPIVKFYKDSTPYPGKEEYVPNDDPNSDSEDVAAISVSAKRFNEKISIGCVAKAKGDDDVYMIGHPNRNVWEVSGKPDSVFRVHDGVIEFQSALVVPGQSGGVLVANNQRCVIGMVVSSRAPHGVAIEIEELAKRLKSVPFQLKVSGSNFWLRGLR